MSIFDRFISGKPQTPEEARQRRLAPLAPAIADAMTYLPVQASALAGSNGYDRQRVFQTRFFGAYWYGFFAYFEDRNSADGDLLRSKAFSVLFGMYEGIHTLGKVEDILEAGDPQAKMGRLYGEQDGNKYFSVVTGHSREWPPVALREAFEKRLVREDESLE